MDRIVNLLKNCKCIFNITCCKSDIDIDENNDEHKKHKIKKSILIQCNTNINTKDSPNNSIN